MYVHDGEYCIGFWGILGVLVIEDEVTLMRFCCTVHVLDQDFRNEFQTNMYVHLQQRIYCICCAHHWDYSAGHHRLAVLCMYRAEKKSLYVLLSDSQAGPGRKFSQPRTKTFSQLCSYFGDYRGLIGVTETIGVSGEFR